MSEIPADLRYTASHEWVRVDEDGTVVIGITDHAQEALGELVFVEAPEEGAELAAGDACAVVESVKAASDIYAPISGVVEKTNSALTDSPELVNEQPYEDGWLMIIKPQDMDDIEKLLTAEQYAEALEE